MKIKLKTRNKRLTSLIKNKVDDMGKTQIFDLFNQSIHEEVHHALKTNYNNDTNALIENYRIRKLTPKECFRLMGVKDDDFEKVAQNQSNSSLYHLAGDSIVVDVLIAIFKQMMEGMVYADKRADY